MKLSVVIPAAGSATRMDGINKQLYKLGSYAVVEHSIQAFLAFEEVCEIIVACREQELMLYKKLLEKYQSTKRCKAIVGGITRQASVFSGINACDSSSDFYCIHDGARPLIGFQEIKRCIKQANLYKAAALGVSVKDTIKIIDASGKVLSTPPRERTYAIQTPQIFEAKLYRKAMKKALSINKEYTDDCQLIEQEGSSVYISQGSYENIKITTPDDIPMIEGIFLEKEKGAKMRIGHGYDVHRLVEDRELILAGIIIPHSAGLLGHSDADVLAHAVMDSILGALALGDIGKHFPDTNEKYKGADSMKLLKHCVSLMEEKHFKLSNIDITVIAQAPKLVDYIERMQANLANVLNCETSQVNVKATTEEKLGFTGQELGIATHAVCLLAEK